MCAYISTHAVSYIVYTYIIYILYYTGWSKNLCAPDDYSTSIRCTETFWSPCTPTI